METTAKNLKAYAAMQPQKTKLYLEIMDLTGVSIYTAERWCKGRNKTTNKKHLEALSELTGIPTDKLF